MRIESTGWATLDRPCEIRTTDAASSMRHSFPTTSSTTSGQSGYYDAVHHLMSGDLRLISGRGNVPDVITAGKGAPFPGGSLIFEDTPAHTVHRGLHPRAFTSKHMAALERFPDWSVDLSRAGGARAAPEVRTARR